MHIDKLPLFALFALLLAGSPPALAMSFDGHDYMATPTVPEATTTPVASAATRDSNHDGAELDSAPPTRSGGAPATLNGPQVRRTSIDDGEGEQAEQRLQRWQSRVPGALK